MPSSRKWGCVWSTRTLGPAHRQRNGPPSPWHDVGSVVTATLLLPVLAIHLPPPWRPSEWGAVAAMIVAAIIAGGWIVLRGGDGYPLGMEPMVPALLGALCCLLADGLLRRMVAS